MNGAIVVRNFVNSSIYIHYRVLHSGIGGEIAMIHYLPAVHSDCEGFERLGRLATATKDLFAGELELDMSGVDSIDANMAAPLAAVLARIADELDTVEIVAVRADVERLLRESGFLANFRYEPLDVDDHVMMPFRRLRLSDEGAFEEYISQQLGSKCIHGITGGTIRIFKPPPLRGCWLISKPY